VVTLPDPALVVLVGPSGAGKSTWAEQRYRREEIVSSDALRGVVGSGPHDLDASDDAFTILDLVVAARLGRGLTTVVDTLGSDAVRRRRWRGLARSAGLPAVAVAFRTDDAQCRSRNAARDRPVPAPVLAAQLTRHRAVLAELAGEGWDRVERVADPGRVAPAAPGSAVGSAVGSGAGPAVGPGDGRGTGPAARSPVGADDRRSSQGLRIVLQVSRFPWGEDPAGWLSDVARAADGCGFAGIAVMDHLIQVPQVDRAWAPIPEAWVTLGLLAGLRTGLSLGPLVTPVTFRPPGITAKAAATLSALTGGRTFLGLGAGWWAREHAAHGLPFPAPAERLDAVEAAIETMRALWSSGTKAYAGDRVSLPETTSYPRPAAPVPIILGGSGRRTLRIAGRLADGVNVPADLATLDARIAAVRAAAAAAGRDPADLAVTVLDLPVVGTDRDDTWARVERLRGRAGAAAYARRTNAGTAADQRDRYGALADRGVDTVFVAVGDLESADDVARLAPLCR
jgi:alkanesulfonate monooxygenase SsuD/methylene tetrahydromethanopterin reductase-like flavin-dependent oxidoreductase (luciferase family)/predicted kinase